MPLIRYSYSYDGKTFTNKRIRFGGIAPKDTKTLLAQYPVNKKVTVFLDPDEPSESTLELEFVHDNLLGIPVICAILAAGCWCLWKGRREFNKIHPIT